MTGDFRKLVQMTLLYVPAQFVPPAVQFATTVLWTHLLDPATFGFVTLIIAAQEVAAIFGLSVWSLYVLRFRARHEERDDAGFRAMDRRMAFTASLLQVALTPLLLILLRIPCDGATIVATAAYLVSRMLLSHYGDWARASHSIFAYTSGQLIGSVVGSIGSGGQVNYSATKAGVIGMARSFARELGSRGITSNVVAPGFVETDMTAVLTDARRQEISAAIPLERFAAPSEVGKAVAFLASDSASYITGAVIPVDGGLGMGH